MPFDPARGQAALRRGRYSSVGAEYFVTCCTDRRAAGLTDPIVGAKILDAMRAAQVDHVWSVRCAVIMPDHLHLLVELGDRLSLGKSVARLKARTAATLRAGGLIWERGFFDHRLRANDDARDVFLYIFLNPYRAGLCEQNAIWPWYACRPDDWIWFRDYLKADRPQPEWLVG
jgi:REP-associated tyrosine transposase